MLSSIDFFVKMYLVFRTEDIIFNLLKINMYFTEFSLTKKHKLQKFLKSLSWKFDIGKNK